MFRLSTVKKIAGYPAAIGLPMVWRMTATVCFRHAGSRSWEGGALRQG